MSGPRAAETSTRNGLKQVWPHLAGFLSCLLSQPSAELSERSKRVFPPRVMSLAPGCGSISVREEPEINPSTGYSPSAPVMPSTTHMPTTLGVSPPLRSEPPGGMPPQHTQVLRVNFQCSPSILGTRRPPRSSHFLICCCVSHISRC